MPPFLPHLLARFRPPREAETTAWGDWPRVPPRECPHEWVNDGPRIPLRYGSAPTEVCTDCGAWRDIRPPVGAWRPAAELAFSFQDPEEAHPPSPDDRHLFATDKHSQHRRILGHE